jgi:hypothetical protein
MKMSFLLLEFVAFYICEVQLVSIIVPIIGSPNECFLDKDDELDDSVPMDVDKDVVVNAQDDMEIHMDPMEVDQDL